MCPDGWRKEQGTDMTEEKKTRESYVREDCCDCEAEPMEHDRKSDDELYFDIQQDPYNYVCLLYTSRCV